MSQDTDRYGVDYAALFKLMTENIRPADPTFVPSFYPISQKGVEQCKALGLKADLRFVGGNDEPAVLSNE